MRITDIVTTPIFLPVGAPLVYSQGAHTGFSRILVEVHTDEGLVGLGECYGGRAREAQLAEYRADLLGEDPFNLERIRWKVGSAVSSKLFGTTLPAAAIDMALLDLQGKALGISVSELLGGRVRDRVDTSAYLFYRHADADGAGAVSNAEDLVTVAQDLVGKYGFGTIKYKNGVRTPDEEIATFKALRAAFPTHELRLDPNAMWSIATAVRVMRELADSDVEYLEDPVWGVHALARVNKKAPWVPLASNMTIFSLEDLIPNLQAEAIDVALLDPHWYGGLSRARLAGQICELIGIDVGLHSGGEAGISLAAMLHLAGTLPNLAVAIDTHYHYLDDDVIVGGKLEITDGAIAVPTGPGLGVTLDPERVATYAELARSNAMGSWTNDPTQEGHVTYVPRW